MDMRINDKVRAWFCRFGLLNIVGFFIFFYPVQVRGIELNDDEIIEAATEEDQQERNSLDSLIDRLNDERKEKEYMIRNTFPFPSERDELRDQIRYLWYGIIGIVILIVILVAAHSDSDHERTLIEIQRNVNEINKTHIELHNVFRQVEQETSKLNTTTKEFGKSVDGIKKVEAAIENMADTLYAAADVFEDKLNAATKNFSKSVDGIRKLETTIENITYTLYAAADVFNDGMKNLQFVESSNKE
jgi:predicted  nucleic acid-binding Zn-ribbon protein